MTITVRRVAIIGAECVGKTELAQQLAADLPGLWVAEYLREFCDRLGRTPTPNEQWHILAEQIAREDAALARAQAAGMGWVLADSAPLVTAIYSEQLFGDRSLHERAWAHHRRYDATLLLAPDLPWIADGFLRDGPAVRAACHELLLRALHEAHLPYALVSGPGEARRQAARATLDSV